MNDETQPKTLYVGNLDGTVSEELLVTLFSQMGPVKNCKIIREPGNDPYAFIEYSTYQAASTALTAMNKRVFLEKEIKVNWATSPGNHPKTDISSHHHIFVGDLSPEIETETLREAFAPFGEISNCRIVRDPQTMKSKGYAFVSFVKKAEAENAMSSMNGQWIGSRCIRTNWSTRKLPPPRESNNKSGMSGKNNNQRQTFEDLYNQSSPTNTTVYCGGFPSNVIHEELMQKHFMQFGPIQDVRVFKDKGYAFIKFLTKESAARAIEITNNSEVHGAQVKCFWGKENGGENSMNNMAAASVNAAAAAAAAATLLGPGGVPATPQQAAAAAAAANAAVAGALPGQLMTQQQIAAAAAAAAQYPYAAYQQMGYWYPPVSIYGYDVRGNGTLQNLASPLLFQSYPAAQMQTQYMQQGYYPYAYSAQQAGAASYRMVQPNVAWGVPGTVVPGSVSAAAASAAAANGSLAPQMMYSAAAMPQYQTQ